MVTGVFSIPLRARRPSEHGTQPSSETRRRGTPEFIAGDENRLALEAFEALARGATDYNPLVFCGDAGSGKSHLARGIAASWPDLRGVPDSEAIVAEARSFCRDVARLRQSHRISAWRERLSSAGLLVIEDVQLLAEHPAAQRELANLLDARVRDGLPLLVTSRVVPASLEGLASALRSRLSAGLIVTLLAPQRPARLALIRACAKDLGIRIDAAGVEALAAGLALNAGDLASAIQCLATELNAGPPGAAITLETVRAYLARRRQSDNVRIGTIAAKVARRYRLQVADLKGPSRRRSVAAARSLTMYLCRRLSGQSLQQIGAYLGNRDHSTIVHGCQKTEQQLATDPQLRAEVALLTAELESPR